MQENVILQFQMDKYMMFLLVIAMGSSLLHCSRDDFSKVNETRIKEFLSERTHCVLVEKKNI